MGIVALEASLATIGPAAFNSRIWLSLLVVPPTCALASVSTTTRRTREELALFAYGGSSWQIILRYFFRGAIIALVAFAQIILQVLLATTSLFEFIVHMLVCFLESCLFCRIIG